MASQWAALSSSPAADHSNAWMHVDQPQAQPKAGHARGWAALPAAGAKAASSWAALANNADDSADDSPPGNAEDAPKEVATVSLATTMANIDAICPTTTLAHVHGIIDELTTSVRTAQTIENIGSICKGFERMCDKLAVLPNHGKTIEHLTDGELVDNFCAEQLSTTTGDNAKSTESHIAECKRTGLKPYKLSQKRATLASAEVQFQRWCADVFLDELCNRVEKIGGTCETLFEKHRGDETPFAKVSAHDDFDDGTIAAISMDDSDEQALADNPFMPADMAVAPLAKDAAEVSVHAHTVVANLKVYQTDYEIGALFILPEGELLTTFKLIQPLMRVDRCTGMVYRWVHHRQSNVLASRRRFRRIQRLHTSDGDKAQDLAERALDYDLRKTDDLYKVPCLRMRCQVHRCYHVITHGLKLYQKYITGQIRLALSLRGPGHFTKFKAILLQYLLDHRRYDRRMEKHSAGIAADRHRVDVWKTYFPTVRGKHQRRNRLKYFIVYRLPNGDIREIGVFTHLCYDGCCKNEKRLLPQT